MSLSMFIQITITFVELCFSNDIHSKKDKGKRQVGKVEWRERCLEKEYMRVNFSSLVYRKAIIWTSII